MFSRAMREASFACLVREGPPPPPQRPLPLPLWPFTTRPPLHQKQESREERESAVFAARLSCPLPEATKYRRISGQKTRIRK